MQPTRLGRLRAWLVGLGVAALLLGLEASNALAAVPGFDRPSGGC